MPSTVENATVANLKKAIIQFKRQRLNQSKMKKADLQAAVRALQITCCPGAPARGTTSRLRKGRKRKPVKYKGAGAGAGAVAPKKKKKATGKKKLFNPKKKYFGKTTTKVDDDIDFTY
jgi:hypothetical protein